MLGLDWTGGYLGIDTRACRTDHSARLEEFARDQRCCHLKLKTHTVSLGPGGHSIRPYLSHTLMHGGRGCRNAAVLQR